MPAIGKELADLGQMVNDPAVSRELVAQKAKAVHDLIEPLKLNPDKLGNAWLTGPGGVPVREWDHAAQVVLALEALRPDLGKQLKAARRRLLFPQSTSKGFNSPRDFGGEEGPLTLEQFEALRAEWARQLQNQAAQ
jgi:hypothetical protein